VIVLILVAVLWIAVLIPSVISKIRERRSAGSILRFHQRLDLLEHTGPKLVEPAYRLTGTDSAARGHDPIVVASPPPVRPNLTLVPPPADDPPYSDAPAEAWAPPPVLEEVVMRAREATDWAGEVQDEGMEPVELSPRDRRELTAIKRRNAARRRRRDVFASLCALAALTGLLGLAHPLRGAWVASAVFLALLCAFVGLAVYGQRIEAERRHLTKLHRVEPARDEDEPTAIVKYLSEDELTQYREAMASYYEEEDRRFAAEA